MLTKAKLIEALEALEDDDAVYWVTADHKSVAPAEVNIFLDDKHPVKYAMIGNKVDRRSREETES